jgi:hypothetical protein
MSGQQQQQNPVKKLTIMGCKDVYHGKNQKGADFTIYEIQATNEQGQVVQETLKSFDELPVGLQAEFEVERYDGGQHGISYTLKRVRPKLGPRVEALEERIIPALEKRIEHLERQLGVQPVQPPPPPTPAPWEQENRPPAPPAQPQQPQPAPPPQPSQPAPIESPPGATFGAPPEDDIPF